MTRDIKSKPGYLDIVVGCQFGDEGKGREVDRRCASGDYAICARFNGGSNAGHQIVIGDKELALHQVPSGITHPAMLNVIGNGSLLDPVRLVEEIAEIERLGFKVRPDNLAISDTSHLVLPHHIMLDSLREQGSEAQGSTKAGIAFTAAEKYQRSGVRAELIVGGQEALKKIIIQKIESVNQLSQEAGLTVKDPEAEFNNWLEAARTIAPYLTDVASLCYQKLEEGLNILAEGAQAVGLDIEQGIYPLSTSSHATPGGALNGLGISHKYLRKVIGVAKLTASKVGGEQGPLVTLVEDQEVATRLRGNKEDVDGEYGKSTGRPRAVGYPDLVQVRRAVKVAGLDELILTKLDLVGRYGPEVKVAIAYEMTGQRLEIAPNSAIKLVECKPIYKTLPTWQEDISDVRSYGNLPPEAKKFIEFIENEVGVNVSALGVGPRRDQMIIR